MNILLCSDEVVKLGASAAVSWGKRGALAMAVLMFGLFVAAPRPALAHANLDRAEPPSGAILDRPPSRLRLTFSESIDPTFSGVEVLNARREQVDRGDSHLPGGETQVLEVSLPESLPDGIYTVAWRTLSTVDGHAVRGAYPLVVGAIAAPPDQAALDSTTTDAVLAPETVVARWLLYVAAALGVGTLVTWRQVLGPVAAGQSESARAETAVRVRRLVLCAAVVLLTDTLYAGLAQAAVAADVPVWNTLGAPLAGVLLRGRYAMIWWPRLALTAAAFGIAAWRGVEGRATPILLGLLGAVLMTSSLVSHGAALSSGTALWVAVDWLHFLGVAVWIGGLANLVLVLPVLARAGEPGGATALGRTIARFSPLALAVTPLIVVTGVTQAALELASWNALIDSLYGRSIVTKALLMSAMLALGAVNLLIIRPRLAGSASASLDAAIRVGRWFQRAVRVELGLGLVALIVGAVLTGLAPGRDEIAQEPGARAAGPVTLRLADQGVAMQVTIAPANVGMNRFAVALPGVDPTGVEQVQFTLTYLDAELGSQPLPLTRVSGSSDRWEVASPLLSQAGRWQAEVLVRRTDADDLRPTFEFSVAVDGGAPTAGTACGPSAGLALFDACTQRRDGAG